LLKLIPKGNAVGCKADAHKLHILDRRVIDQWQGAVWARLLFTMRRVATILEREQIEVARVTGNSLDLS